MHPNPMRRRILRTLQDDLDPDVEDCAQSIKEDNPEMDKSQAIAICKDMQNRGVLESYLEADPRDDDAALGALAEFRNPGDIRRIETDDGVRYENVMLLAPGAWTDAGSRSTAIYSGEGIRASAENWVNPATREPLEEAELNFLHGPTLHNATVLGDIGSIPVDSVVVDDQDRMFGDLVLHGDNAASELAIELMDEVLEAADDPEQETPPVGPSVEIIDEEFEHDERSGVKRLTEVWYSGVGLVFNPASRPVEMEQQVRERAVAMADDMGYDHAGLVLHRDGETGGEGAEDGSGTGETVLNGLRHGPHMAPSQRERINKLLEEMQAVLQTDEELELTQTLVEQYRQAGEDMDAPATEFVAWLEENADIDPAELQGVFDTYVEAVGAESLEETPVQGLADWVEEQMGGGGGEGDGEGDGEGEGDDEMTEEELREAVNTIGTFADELESLKEMLSDYREGVDEDIAELEDELEEKDRRLKTLEDQPVRQARENRDATDFVESEGDDGEGRTEASDGVYL